jgi:Transcriptional regulator
MRLRHIEIFEAIRRTGSLTEAAQILHVSQPAASKMLAHAEAQLGFKLFERVKGRLRATREAEILAPQVTQLTQNLSSVRRLATSLRYSQRGHLRVGCTPALGLGLLPPAVRASRDAHPGVSFSIHTHHSAELIDGLLSRELDLVVTFATQEHPGIERMPIGQTELVHIGTRRRSGPLDLKTWKPDNLIALDARDPTGAVLHQAMESLGVSAKVSMHVQTHYVACALAEAGCGETVVDAITGRAMLRPGMVLTRLRPRLRIPISVMVHGQDPLSALHRSFIDRLTAVCREFEEWEQATTHGNARQA